MKFNFVKMNKEYAEEIAFNWKYDGEFSFYDMTDDKEDFEEFLNPDNWDDTYAVIDEDVKLIGFYSYYFKDEIMWIGFALRPELTGKGFGEKFVLKGIQYGTDNYSYKKDYIMLAVAEFNKRAINLYKKIGFKTVKTYDQKTNGGIYKFISMKKILN